MRGRYMEARIFKSEDSDGKEVCLRFNRPTQVVLSKGDFVYREYFSKAIRAGVMTAAEANKILKDRGIWSDELEGELVAMRINLARLEEKLKPLSREEGMPIFKEIKTLRRDIDELTEVRTSVTNNTAESVASEMRTQFYTSECVVYNDSGERVFRNLDDFLSRLDEKLTLDCYKQALISNYEQVLGIDVPLDFTAELSEDNWLEDKKRETEEEKPKTKRRGRKKKTTTKA